MLWLQKCAHPLISGMRLFIDVANHIPTQVEWEAALKMPLICPKYSFFKNKYILLKKGCKVLA